MDQNAIDVVLVFIEHSSYLLAYIYISKQGFAVAIAVAAMTKEMSERLEERFEEDDNIDGIQLRIK